MGTSAKEGAAMTWSQTGWNYARETVAAVAIVGTCIAWRFMAGGPQAEAVQPQAAARSQPAPAAKSGAIPPGTKPVAIVNGAEITADQLAAECLARHGNSVIETIVNRRIIEQACRQAGVTVSRQDVEAEIDAMSRRFNVPKDKYVELIQRERGVTAQQYADDIVWPMIALRKLSQSTAEPTSEEIQEAYEKQFGPAVKARIIVLRTRREADEIRGQALAAPDDFPGLARRYSVDVGSASADGWVQPIRLHSGEPQFDRAAFQLKPGQISDVVQVADQYIIIKCEGHLPAAGVKLDDAQPHLAAELRDAKSRKASGDIFRRLQDAATVENVLNDPAKSVANRGVAARVNGQPVDLEQVRTICLDRHGSEVLEILVTRKLIEQALVRERQPVAQADVDAEIARAAESMGFKKPDGSPEAAAWLKHVTGEEKIPLKHYLEDVVWPSVALKKLVGGVPVLQDDLDKAFAATFGPRSKCRVIVLDNQRRAQEVWQLARQNPTLENFGNLAETYSVDPTTKSLRGEVPPIRRWGGQPALEREAFALKPGELSGVLQVADRFMVLFCEGYTEPAKVSFEEVRGELHADLFEKKQRIEMARYFSHMREAAAIDNFLAGTSQTPTKPAGRESQPVAALPKSTLTRADAEELSKPRAGSAKAAAAGGSEVVPASLNAPIGSR
jgi:parvulin-like peptidyl-prolyl isomerase